MKPLDIICFAGAAYDIPYWTNRQEIMTLISKKHRVLYVEPRIFILTILKDIFKNPRKFFSGEKKNENFYVIGQINYLPFSRKFFLFNFINQKINEFFVKKAARKYGFAGPVIWIYDTEACYYLGKLNEKFIFYDCVDKHESQGGVERNREKIKNEEQNILKKAKVVATTSNALFKEKIKENPNTFLVRNVGDYKNFNPEAILNLEIKEDMKNIPHPIAGFVGAIDTYKINLDLIVKTALENPKISFVLIGKSFIEQGGGHNLNRTKNIYFLGPRPQKEIPSYVKTFDVCLIPYQENEYNEYSFPLKFFDYMATGKPIIVSGLPELLEFKDLIEIVKTPLEFSSALKKVLLKERGDKRQKRIEIASKNTWETRTQKLLEILENSYKDA